jgi:hypothetical protein
MKSLITHKQLKGIPILLMLLFLLCSTLVFGQSGNIDQIRNGSGKTSNQGVLDTCGKCWVNGNAGASNAHYTEGMSIAYRSLLTGLTAGNSYEYVIEYDTYHGAMAIDYLTHYQRLEPHGPFGHPAEVIKPLIFLNGSTEYKMAVNSGPTTLGYLPPDSCLISSGSTLNIHGQPTKSFNALPAAERVMTIYNGTLAALTYDHQDAIVISGNNNTATRVRIRFTANKDSVLLVWGGHIASRLDWGISTTTGKSLSAAGISGSPYHMRQISMNTYPGNVNIPIGNQDRSLSAAAVVPPPACPSVPSQTKCLGSTSFVFTIASPEAGTTYTWSISTDGVGAAFSGGTNTGNSVTIVPSGSAFTNGSFTLDITALRNGVPQTCPGVATGTVVAVKVGATATPASLDLAVSNTSKLTAVLTGSDDTDSTHYTYSWAQNPASGGSLNFNNIKTPIFTATAAGSYTFTVTATQTAAPNCSDTGIVVVNVSASAPPCAVSGPSPICPGSTNTYKYDFDLDGTADPLPSNFTAAWSLINNTNSASINGSTTGNTVSVTAGSTCGTSFTIRIILTSTSGLIKDTCQKTVSVNDVTPPTITNCPADLTLDCDGDTSTTNTGVLTATDNCSVSISHSDVVTGSCSKLITRTWTATDPCGNTSTCVQHIITRDRTAPIINCPTTGNATATDNCTATANIKIFYRDNGTTRTWTAVDESGNQSSCTQTISNQPIFARTNNSPTITNATTVNNLKADVVKFKSLTIGSEIKVQAYPNPYSKEINFQFVSPVSGQATMNLYNLSGQKLAVVYNGRVSNGVIYTVKYKNALSNKGTILYRLAVGNKIASGKLLSVK